MSEVGTQHLYWNQGYCLLSQVIAKASGQSYPDALRELIFEPAKMKGTCFTGDEKPEGFQITTGIGKIGEPRTCLEHPYGSYGLQYQGTGGIVSHVGDLWNFHCAIRDNLLLDEKHTALMFDPGEFEYALGWKIGVDESQKAYQSHGGKIRGFNADFRRYPESDSLIAILSNDDSFYTPMVTNIISGFLFTELPDPLDVGLAEKLVGEYSTERNQLITIELKDESLSCSVDWANGAVSHGFILQNNEGEPVMHQPGSEDVPLKVELGDASANALSFLELTFTRKN